MIKYRQIIRLTEGTSTRSYECDYYHDRVYNTYLPESLAYFCSDCGSIWARFTRFLGNNIRRWGINHVKCFKCSSNSANWPMYPIGGSLYNPFDNINQLNTWPLELLEREVLILLNNYEEIISERGD